MNGIPTSKASASSSLREDFQTNFPSRVRVRFAELAQPHTRSRRFSNPIFNRMSHFRKPARGSPILPCYSSCEERTCLDPNGQIDLTRQLLANMAGTASSFPIGNGNANAFERKYQIALAKLRNLRGDGQSPQQFAAKFPNELPSGAWTAPSAPRSVHQRDRPAPARRRALDLHRQAHARCLHLAKDRGRPGCQAIILHSAEHDPSRRCCEPSARSCPGSVPTRPRP